MLPDPFIELRFAPGIWTMEEMRNGIPPRMVQIVKDGVVRYVEAQDVGDLIRQLGEHEETVNERD